MGGPIVLLYGARHPGHAAGLVVHGGFARWDTPRMVEGFRRVAGDEIAELARRDYSGDDDVTDEESARVYAAFGLVPDEEREAGTPKNLELNAHGGKLMLNLDIVDQLSRLDSPTLVCVGELDPVTPVAASEEIVRALPEGIAQLEVIPGAGHFTWLEAPDRFWSTIIEFIHRATPATLLCARVDFSLRCQAKDLFVPKPGSGRLDQRPVRQALARRRRTSPSVSPTVQGDRHSVGHSPAD